MVLPVRINDKTKPKFETKFTNKVKVSDVIQLMEGVVKAHLKLG